MLDGCKVRTTRGAIGDDVHRHFARQGLDCRGTDRLAQAGSNDGHTQVIAHVRIDHRAHDDGSVLAGQVAVDGDGNIVGEGDMRAQVRQVMENLKTVLASQGADFGDVVKVTIYTTDVAAYRETGDIRAEYWTEGAPASTLVQIDQLARPVFLVEIEATAIAPD